MTSRWSTKEEVQADLARATGQRIPLVDEGCLVYGERPPPRLTIDEETEEEHQLQCGVSMAKLQQPSPDLRGITNMLRMIQDYGNCDSTQNLTTPTNEVVVISKLTPNSPKPDPIEHIQSTLSSSNLNPNVKEFVPKFSTTSRNECKIDLGIDPTKTSDESETNNNVASTEHGAAYSMTDEQRKEREELAIMLKSKIQAPAHDCPRRRRERYTAIAGLLRLHSSPSPSPPSHSPPLRTPDYFRTHRASPATEEATPTTAGREAEPECDATPDEREVRASIDKVGAWLRRSRAAAPGPAPAPADVRYVPSAGASALRAQYAARAAAEPAPPPSLWERLERDLRRKDAECAVTAGDDFR